MSIWKEIKHSLNGRLGSKIHKPLDELNSMIMYETSENIITSLLEMLNFEGDIKFIPWGTKEVGNNEFQGSQIRMVFLPNTLVKIGEQGFNACTQLTNVLIPNGVTRIESDAFVNCENLKNISIPSSVEYIGEGAFYNCIQLRSFDLPYGIACISKFMFTDCENLSKVNIPSSVTSIEEGAFSGCDALDYISIPVSVKSIGDEAFYGSGLQTLRFNGTMEEWGDVIIGINAFSEGVSIRCNDGFITV